MLLDIGITALVFFTTLAAINILRERRDFLAAVLSAALGALIFVMPLLVSVSLLITALFHLAGGALIAHAIVSTVYRMRTRALRQLRTVLAERQRDERRRMATRQALAVAGSTGKGLLAASKAAAGLVARTGRALAGIPGSGRTDRGVARGSRPAAPRIRSALPEPERPILDADFEPLPTPRTAVHAARALPEPSDNEPWPTPARLSTDRRNGGAGGSVAAMARSLNGRSRLDTTSAGRLAGLLDRRREERQTDGVSAVLRKGLARKPTRIETADAKQPAPGNARRFHRPPVAPDPVILRDNKPARATTARTSYVARLVPRR